MTRWTDVCIDIETTGTSPDLSAIIQIGAVQFNLETREVNPDFFNRCLFIPPRRFWASDTQEWWMKMPDLLRGIFSRMEEPTLVMEDFYTWLGGAYCQLRPWSRPLSFDIPFIESYFKDMGRSNPLSHWRGRDIRSYIHGMGIDFDEKSIPFVGTPHDALDDALHELRTLYAAKDQLKCGPSSLEING